MCIILDDLRVVMSLGGMRARGVLVDGGAGGDTQEGAPRDVHTHLAAGCLVLRMKHIAMRAHGVLVMATPV